MTEETTHSNFIRTIIEDDIASGKHTKIQTRFPPEPNGYLHIGHAKAIWVDFSMADLFGGKCNLRFDDTNPTKEEDEFVEAIKEDIKWLGFDWEDRLFYASDYFQQLYDFAVQLIKGGDAYVDDLSADEIREYRGTLTEPGKPSPHRDRSVEENLDLFERMKNGEFDDGAKVLRAKIDMASGNINMRDPVMYRIMRVHHHRTGDKWCIYPTYDWTHGQSDSIEGVTHSICTLEFEDHRPLYEWYIEKLGIFPSKQYEFARMELSYTLMSKRKLRAMIEEGIVKDWDDPRMPTLRGFRRRGFTPGSIRNLAERTGVARRKESVVDYALLEHCLRDELNTKANRYMAVLDPLKVVITNYPEGQVEKFDAVNNPEDESAGTRCVSFSREIYIERSDYMEDPPKKFFRLGPGREVRLKHAYYITCDEAIKDDDGNIIELRCTYDPESRGGGTPDGRRVKGTLHWVSVRDSVKAEVRLYEQLFTEESPFKIAEADDFHALLNPNSITVLTECMIEPALAELAPESHVQFMRHGYFVSDLHDHRTDKPVFNRITTLRDTWGKMQKKKG